MEKQKSPSYMTFVIDTTNWSDASVNRLVFDKSTVKVSCSDVMQERDTYMTKIKQLEAEIKRLKWMMTEHD